MAVERTIISQRPTNRLFGQYIIKNQFQFKFSIILFALLSSSTFILWLESKFAVSQLIDSGAVFNPDSITQLHLLTNIIGGTGFLIMAITFGLTLFLSHFIAGPIYRFERTFIEMRNGNLAGYVRLRKHDELQDTADMLNQGLVSLRNKIKKDREGLTEMLTKVKTISKDMRTAGKTTEADEIDNAIKQFESLPPQVKID